MNNRPSPTDLCEMFSYDKLTGLVRWRISPHPRVKVGTAVKSKFGSGYLRVKINRITYRLHNVIWAMVTGSWPAPGTVDHFNRKRSDNRWSNLKEVDPGAQQRNRVLKNLTGFKGVSFKRGKYEATISIYGKPTYLGRFHSAQEAADAYDEVGINNYGECFLTNKRIKDETGYTTMR